MPPSVPPYPGQSKTSKVSAEQPWRTEGTTLNPSPDTLKQGRDTAEGCRERAAADLLEAQTASTTHERQMLERSAASWTARAELLERTGERGDPGSNPFELTPAEIAEDAPYVRP